MAKTSKQIQGYIYRLLKNSPLYAQELLSGDVYRKGNRPRDSRKEDAVVIFTAGLAGQIQEGTVTVDIYVPDTDPYGNGVWVEDGQRLEEVERLAQLWVDWISDHVTDYGFELKETIRTEEEPDIRQHFVVVKLNYRLFETEDF